MSGSARKCIRTIFWEIKGNLTHFKYVFRITILFYYSSSEKYTMKSLTLTQAK